MVREVKIALPDDVAAQLDQDGGLAEALTVLARQRGKANRLQAVLSGKPVQPTRVGRALMRERIAEALGRDAHEIAAIMGPEAVTALNERSWTQSGTSVNAVLSLPAVLGYIRADSRGLATSEFLMEVLEAGQTVGISAITLALGLGEHPANAEENRAEQLIESCSILSIEQANVLELNRVFAAFGRYRFRSYHDGDAAAQAVDVLAALRDHALYLAPVRDYHLSIFPELRAVELDYTSLDFKSVTHPVER